MHTFQFPISVRVDGDLPEAFAKAFESLLIKDLSALWNGRQYEVALDPIYWGENAPYGYVALIYPVSGKSESNAFAYHAYALDADHRPDTKSGDMLQGKIYLSP
jgi:hypothetical protein